MDKEWNDVEEIQSRAKDKVQPIQPNEFLFIDNLMKRVKDSKVSVFEERKDVFGRESFLRVDECGLALLRIRLRHASDAFIPIGLFLLYK